MFVQVREGLSMHAQLGSVLCECCVHTKWFFSDVIKWELC